MKVINVQPNDIWEHYEENEKDFTNGMVETIAENLVTGVEILLQKWGNEWDDSLLIEVVADNEEIYSEFICDKSAPEIIQQIYDKYLSDNIFDDWEQEDIVDREEELNDALLYMLEVFHPNFEADCEDVTECIEDLKGIIKGYLIQVHGLSID